MQGLFGLFVLLLVLVLQVVVGYWAIRDATHHFGDEYNEENDLTTAGTTRRTTTTASSSTNGKDRMCQRAFHQCRQDGDYDTFLARLQVGLVKEQQQQQGPKKSSSLSCHFSINDIHNAHLLHRTTLAEIEAIITLSTQTFYHYEKAAAVQQQQSPQVLVKIWLTARLGLL